MAPPPTSLALCSSSRLLLLFLSFLAVGPSVRGVTGSHTTHLTLKAAAPASAAGKQAAGSYSTSTSGSAHPAILQLAADHPRHHHHQQQQQQLLLQLRPHVQLIRRSLVADSTASVSATEAASGTTSAAAIDARRIPVYGNWCGPNYGSGVPIDEIDTCCKQHDDCYDAAPVYHHCTCDQNIVRCLNKITSIQRHNLVKRALRASIVAYFDNTACRCSKQSDLCMPVKSCACPAFG